MPRVAAARAAAGAFRMSPHGPLLGRLTGALNGLGLWRRTQPVWGLAIRAETFDRTLYLCLHRLGLMGSAERATLRRLAGPAMLVVDVGANLGLYSAFLSRCVGAQGRVISFEPDPDLHRLLVANCAANACANVEAHNLALGDGPGRMALSRSALNGGDNHLGPVAHGAFRRSLEVDVAALDLLMPGLAPGLVKLDVQGWELRALRGMAGLLGRVERVGVLLEVCPRSLRRAGDSPEDLFGFLGGLGFGLYSCADWTRHDRASFLSVAAGLRGQAHVDVFASRVGPPAG